MKHLFFLIFLTFALNSCDIFISKENLNRQISYNGFEPIDPIIYINFIPVKDSTAKGKDTIVYKSIRLLSNEQLLNYLNNESCMVSIGQYNSSGKLDFNNFGYSQKNNSYQIIMDYSKFTINQIIDSTNKDSANVKVGVGLRIIASIYTTESNINLNNIFSISAAANENKLSGSIMIEVIGIKSKDVTTVIPLPNEINSASIQNAMQAMATIKSKIYDSNTNIFPQVLAIQKKGQTNIEGIKSILTTNIK